MSLSHLRLLHGHDLERATPSEPPHPTQLHEIVPAGRVVQFSGDVAGARSSCAAALLARRQQHGETAAWISPTGMNVYPPDLDAHGVDLEALVFIRLPDTALPYGACRATELLLQSGAFGVVVLDLSVAAPPSHEQAWLNRLAGSARHHQTLLILLTAPSRVDTAQQARSLGPLVFVHATPTRRRAGESGAYEIQHLIHKYKAGGTPSLPPERWRAPWGVR